MGEEASTVASRGMVRFEGAGHKPPPNRPEQCPLLIVAAAIETALILRMR